MGGRNGIRRVKTEWWGAGVVICLELGADLHMAQLMPLPLRLVLPFRYRLSWVVPEKGPLNGCVCVVVIPPVVKIPGVKNQQKVKSKCRMAGGPVGQLAECRAKSRVEAL